MRPKCFTMTTMVLFSAFEQTHCAMVICDSEWMTAYLSAHTVYHYKIQLFFVVVVFLIILGGIWPYWKMDPGKHNFHEILLF